MPTALIIRHTPYEGVAGFRQPIEAAGYHVDRIDVSDPDFPQTDFLAPDLLVMMGGPMGVYEIEAHPWIPCQLRKLGERVARGLPTIGVCLGAQMIAAAAGGRVFPGPVKEVGFAEIDLLEPGADSPLQHIAGVPVLHWHGDTFDLPPGAELLAQTRDYPQAFRIGNTILALQCHPEMGEDPRFDDWLDGADDYVAEAGTSPDQLREAYATHGKTAVDAGRRLLEDWLGRLSPA
jgi:GMP synthase (glutamine-hydrolysing)